MTPYPQTGMRNPTENNAGSSAQLYNSVSSSGVPVESSQEQSQQPVEQNPAEAAIAKFSETFNIVDSMLQQPEFQAATKEADLVKRAMQNLLEAVVGKLSLPSGESLQNNL
jgi:hypothetical protein